MPTSKKKSKREKQMWKRPESSRKANYTDIQRALTQHGAEILEQIPLDKVQLSQPIDGTGARICVSVEAGEEHRVPESIIIKIGRKYVCIPIEALGDYETIEAQ